MPQDIQYLLLTFYSNLANLEISQGRTDIHPLIENTQPNDFHIQTLDISKRRMSQLQLFTDLKIIFVSNVNTK